MIFSARSVRRGVLPIALGLAVAACSREQSTEPGGPVPLTAIDLSTELVTGVSDWVEAEQPLMDIYTFSLGHLPAVQTGESDDLHVQFVGTWYAETFDMHIFVPCCSVWCRVEDESLLNYGRVSPPGSRTFHRLASGFDLGEVGDLLDPTGRLRIRANHIGAVRVHTVSYTPEYEFVTLNPMSAIPYAAAALNGDRLWVARAFADQNREQVDSLFIYTLDGVREEACHLPNLHIMSMCCSPQGQVWAAVYVAYRMHKFSLVGQDGHEQASFTYPDPIRSDITWWDDRIWFMTGDLGSKAIVGVNVAASVQAGEAVVDRQYEVDFGGRHFDGLFIEDGSLYGIPSRGSSLWRFSFTGEVLEEWSVPVGSVECIARDSTSLWVIHHGPSQAPTNGVLLTRFLFP